MYHGIYEGAQPAGAHPVHISLAAFREQMSWLKASGYTTLRSEDLENKISAFAKTPQHVVITFDDGLGSQLDLAAPILQEFGFTATAFVVSAWAQNPQYGRACCAGLWPGERVLSWQELQTLVAAGWSIGSHCAEHLDCRGLSAAALRAGFAESKLAIAEHLSVECRSLAYPFGHYHAEALAVCAEEYHQAFSVHGGLATQIPSYRYRKHRLEINNSVNIKDFSNMITDGSSNYLQSVRNSIRDLLYLSVKRKDTVARASNQTRTYEK